MLQTLTRTLVLSSLVFALACGDDGPTLPDSGPYDGGGMTTDGGGETDGGTETDGGSSADGGTIEEPCLAPRQFCGTECVDLRSDAMNCGRCENECTGGTVCSAGTCLAECDGALTACGAECVDTETSGNHCGGCADADGEVCRADQECVSGACGCTEGRVECGDACVNTDTSNAHCGACDQPCDGSCVDGTCMPGPEMLCDDDMDNDMDEAVDCADDDCNGAERACTCEGTTTMSTQTCMDGAWGDCRGCAAPPECSDANPCMDYGTTCVEDACALDRTSLWNLEIVAAQVPAQDFDGGDWDWDYLYDPRPDPYVRARFVQNGGPRDSLMIRNGESESTTTFENGTLATWSPEDGLTLTDISADVFDEWDLELTIYDGDGLTWETICQVRYDRDLGENRDTDLFFDGTVHTVQCDRDEDEEWVESTIRIRFTEPMTGS